MTRNPARNVLRKTQSIVVGFVVKAQSIVVECLRLDSGLKIITADFAQSLKAPSLRQQKGTEHSETTQVFPDERNSQM